MGLGLKFKKFFLVLLLIELALAYSPVYAQTQPSTYKYATQANVSNQIKQYLCAPTDVTNSSNNYTNAAITNSSGQSTVGQIAYQQNAAQTNQNNSDLFNCINRLYKFSIALAMAVGVFFIVIAGYIYMSAEGSQESVDKAKNILTSTIASLVILFAGYLLLNALNPDIIQFQTIQPTSVVLNSSGNATNLGNAVMNAGGAGTTAAGNGAAGAGGAGVSTQATGGVASGVGAGTSGTGFCAPITDSSNPAAVSNLQNSCLAANATLFSEIANEETRGGNSIPSQSDKCADGNPVSFGLFQINISATTAISVNGVPCNMAFSKPYTSTDKSCVVTNQTLYQQCAAAALDPNQNIQAACSMSSGGTNLKPWNGSCFQTWISN